MKEGFKQLDFINGDECTLRDGRVVYYKNGWLSDVGRSIELSLSGYSFQLTRIGSVIGNEDLSSYDIMRVMRSNEVVFERSEQPTSSCDEIFKQASKVDKLERYFFFCISYYTKRGSGRVNTTIKDNRMPSFKELEESTRKRVSRELSVQESSITVVVDNWIEMNEEDFNSWVNCD